MITKHEINQFIGYNEYGYNGRSIPDKYKLFSNSKEFEKLLLLFDRLILEKNTKTSASFSNETKKEMGLEFDSIETIDLFNNYVLSYDPNKKSELSKAWWKIC